MSTLGFLLGLILFATPVLVAAQSTVVVAVRDMARATVDVEIRCQGPCSTERNISFKRESAGVPFADSGDRITSLEAFGENGAPVAVKKFQPYEYLAEATYQRIVIRRALETPDTVDKLAFRSWVLPEEGVLMLSDLMPEQARSGVVVRFVLPQGVFAIGSGKGGDGRTFRLTDPSDGVFMVARQPEYGTSTFGGSSFTIASVGQWPVRDSDRVGMVNQILRSYQDLFKADPVGDPVVFLVRPQASRFPANKWAAQVKGSTALIVSTGVPFGTQEPQRLHEQLRHELFHMWVPNSLALDGRYDWFYEGFAQYESLKMAAGLNRITFDDFLATLARSYDVVKADAFPMSLIEASDKRFQGSQSRIYSRGMLVALMLDVEMVDASEGRRSSADIFRELNLRHRKPGRPTDGNSAVTELLATLPELRPIVDSYIKGREALQVEPYLQKSGLSVSAKADGSVLTVVPKPTDAQRRVLRRMGYNAPREQQSQ